MIRMNGIKPTVLSLALTLAIGCSNMNSPVSISKNDPATVAATTIGSLAVRDVASAGPTNLWGLSYNDQVSGEDFYIYKYNTSTSSWVNTNHYGKCITVSPSGRCYHVNASNQIWWGDGAGAYGNISNLSGLTDITDISVSNLSSTYDQFWVLGTNTSGTHVKRCTVDLSSGTAFWDTLNSVYVPTGGTVVKISRDPFNSAYAALILETNSIGSREVHATDNYGYTWTLQSINPTGPQDVAICGGNIIISAASISGALLLKGTINQSYQWFTTTIPFPVAADKNGSTYYLYYLDSYRYVTQDLF